MAQILRVHDGDEETNPTILLRVPGVTFAPCMYESAIYAYASMVYANQRAQSNCTNSREEYQAKHRSLRPERPSGRACRLSASELTSWTSSWGPHPPGPQRSSNMWASSCASKTSGRSERSKEGGGRSSGITALPLCSRPARGSMGEQTALCAAGCCCPVACVLQAAVCDICNVTHTGFHFSRDSGRMFEQSLYNDHTRFQPVKTTKTCIPKRRCADQAGRAACRLYCHPAYRVYITPRCS